MAFNGSGTFIRLYTWVSDRASTIPIASARMDSEMNGFANGLSNCITRDGQGKPTQAIDWNAQQITNIASISLNANPTLSSQVANKGYVDTAVAGVAPIASAVTSTPAGGITSSNVQAALNELDTKKAALAGANIFTASPQTVRNPATSLLQSFFKWIGGDGTGIGAQIQGICTATGLSQWSEYFGALETRRTVYNAGVPETQFLYQAYAPFQTLTDAATIAWDVSVNQNAVVTLAGNRVLGAPTNLKNGAVYNLLIKQDATGTRTLDVTNAVFKWPTATKPVLPPAANAVSLFSFISDGTNLYSVSALDLR